MTDIDDEMDHEDAMSDDGTDQAGKELTLEGRLSRLEEILARMESEEIELEEALGLFEEGVAHVRQAEQILSETELKVEELLSDGTTRPMETDQA